MKYASIFAKGLFSALLLCVIAIGEVAFAQTSFQVTGRLGDITFDGGFIYMSTMSGFRHIQKIDPVTKQIEAFITKPDQGINDPRGIAGDGKGRLFLTNLAGTVYESTTSGALITTFTLPDPVPDPHNPGFRSGAIAFDGINLYVGDIDAPTIVVVNRESGATVRNFNSGRRPDGMVFDPATGNFWVVDIFLANKMTEMSADGTTIRQCDITYTPGAFGLGGIALSGSTFYIAHPTNPDDPEQGTTIHVVDRSTLVCDPPVTPPAPEPQAPQINKVLGGLGTPFSVAIYQGFAYVADPSTHTVWKISLSNPLEKAAVAGIGWKTDVDPQDRQGFNGDGINAREAQLDNPSGVAIDPETGRLYIADTGNHAVRWLDLTQGVDATIFTAAGIPTSYAVGEDAPAECAEPPTDFDTTPCLATNVRLFGPRAVAVDQNGNVFIADRMNQQIKRVDKATGFMFVVAGVAGETGFINGLPVGPAFCADEDCTPGARLNSPVGVAVAMSGRFYIGDEGNNSVRFWDGEDVRTLDAGTLLRPTGVAVSPDGTTVYTADYGNHRIQRTVCNSAGSGCTTTTVAGTTGTPGSSATPGGLATAAQLNSPIAVALDGNLLYIVDMANGRVVVIDLTPPPPVIN